MGYMWGGSDPYKKAVRAKLTGDASDTAWNKPNPPKPKPPNYNDDYYNTAGDSAWNKTHPKDNPEKSPDPNRELTAAIRAQQEAEAARLQASINKGVSQLESQRPEVENSYQNGAQQQYVMNMQNKKNLPQIMAASGLTGGVHESTLSDINNTYENNLGKLRSVRDDSMNDISRDISNIRATGDISLAENTSRFSDKIQNALREARATSESEASGYGDTSRDKDDEEQKAADRQIKLLRTTPVKNWINKVTENQTKLRPKDKTQKKKEIEAALQAAYNQNMFTLEEMEAIAKYYGMDVTDAI